MVNKLLLPDRWPDRTGKYDSDLIRLEEGVETLRRPLRRNDWQVNHLRSHTFQTELKAKDLLLHLYYTQPFQVLSR